MSRPALCGWLLGLFLGAVLAISIRAALALPIPHSAALLSLPFPRLALLLIPLIYLQNYALATAALADLLLCARPVAAPTELPMALPEDGVELFARSKMIGFTAALNAALLGLVPAIGPVLDIWAVAIISLAAVPRFAQSPLYKSMLGWSSWLLPMSYLATLPGFMIFVVNAPFALMHNGTRALRFDWRTGVIETAGGLTAINKSAAGFSLGNFNFVTSVRFQGNFSEPCVSSHEIGHTLNTAALGGIVLWINAVDENVWPFQRLSLAYGELLAESHTMALTGTSRREFFIRFWCSITCRPSHRRP